MNSETPDYSQVPVARSVLEDMIRARLQKEEHSGAEIDKLTAHLIAAATQRLVLLVPALDENIDFEVRSLREFMAARALTSGKDEVVLERLTSLATSAHWRNVWLFAAGRLFLDREHLRDSILTLLRGVDTESLLSLVVRPGAVLATALLGDDLAARSPRYRRLLAAHATERVSALRDENVFDLGGVTSLAAVVFLAAEDDAIISASVRRTMDQALASDARVGTTAAWLLAMWSAWTGELAAWARSRTGGSSVLPKESGFSDGSNSKNGPEALTYLRPFLQVIEPAGADAKFIALLEAVDLRLTVVQDLDGEVGGAIRISQRTLPEIPILKDVFDVPDLADIYADLVDSVSSDNLWVASALKSIASYWFWRKPVSHMLH